MSRLRGVAFLACLLACFACDQATKQVASRSLAESGPVSVAGDLVRLELVTNPGAFLSLGAGLSPGTRQLIFVVVVPLLLAGLSVVLLRTGRLGRAELLGLALLAGGGLGNWLDRVLNAGAVTDFVSLGVGGLRTGIFNFADVAILLGAGLLAFGLRSPEPEPEPEDAAS